MTYDEWLETCEPPPLDYQQRYGHLRAGARSSIRWETVQAMKLAGITVNFGTFGTFTIAPSSTITPWRDWSTT